MEGWRRIVGGRDESKSGKRLVMLKENPRADICL